MKKPSLRLGFFVSASTCIKPRACFTATIERSPPQRARIMDGMSPNSLEKQLSEQTTQLRLLEAAWRAEKDLQQAENARLREQYQEAERARQAQHRLELEQQDIELRNQKALHEARMAAIEQVNKETLRKVDSLHTTVILTGISSVITVILGVGAINAAIVNNMLAAYNGGKDNAAWQAQIQQSARETDAYLRRSEATLQRMQQSLGPAPKP
jgi:hypothetical protein